MDCKTARLLLEYARPKPAELAEGDASALAGHLHTCPDCDALARGERQFDAHLGRAVRGVPLPDGLRDRLLTRLAAERRAWYRRKAWRCGPVAAAAVMVLALSAYWFWPRHNLPTPDLYAIEFPVSTQLAQGKSVKDVHDWFGTARGLRDVVVPAEIRGEGTLDYSLLTYYDLAPCQGQQVPMLLFVTGTLQARIYILSDRQFNLAEDQDDNNGQVTVLYRPMPERHVAYVIVLTGTNSLKRFLSVVETRPAT
jgi:hypothetical protein